MLNSNRDTLQGMSQFGESFGINDGDFETGTVNVDKMINFFELPSVLQSHIEKIIAVTTSK